MGSDQKNAIFSWSSELEKSFRALNDQLLYGITLALPNVDKGLVLRTDASALGVAGYLAWLSTISPKSSRKLGLNPQEDQPVTIELANGNLNVISQSVVCDLTVISFGFIREAKLYISPNQKVDLILGLPELHGYNLTVGPQFNIEYVGVQDCDCSCFQADKITPIVISPAISATSCEVPEAQQKLQLLPEEFQDIFNPIDESPFKLPLFSIKLIPDAVPVCHAPRTLSPEKTAWVKQEIKRLEDLHILESIMDLLLLLPKKEMVTSVSVAIFLTV